MNACIIAYTFYEVDFRVRRYAEALSNGKNTVDVIALRKEGQERIGKLNGVNIIRLQTRNYEKSGLFSYFANYAKFFVLGSIVLLRRYFEFRYDIIHVHNVPDFLVFMGAIPKVFGARLILDIHDILPEFYCQKYDRGMNTVFAKALLGIEKASARFADHVIVANDIWREKMIERDGLNRDDCTTIMNYPASTFFQATQKPEQNGSFRLIYPGTLSHQHGLDVLIRAMGIVKQRNPRVRLEIYSRSDRSPVRRELDALISELGVSGTVRFHDEVPPEEIAGIIRSCDAGVVPKRDGIFAGEAFSTKIFDFMAAGIPVIASKTKVDTYYFDESMVKFFPAEDHEALANAILEIADNPDLRRRMVEAGRAFIASNTWEIKKELYVEIIGKLTGHSGPNAKK